MRELTRSVLDMHLRKVFKERQLGKTIDLGGKNSPYKKWMQTTKYICIDINPKNNPDIVADAHNLSMIQSNSYDTVVATEVLEHCAEPKKVIKEICRILKKGGHAIISTPFLYPYHPDPKDYFRYTKDGLSELCKEFEQVTILPLGNRFFFFWEMLTWKIPLFKIMNKVFLKIFNYRDENGPVTYFTIARK